MRSSSALLRFSPFLRWPRPSKRSLRADAWAGITVGLVLVPQSLAYATLAGMPPHTGLYAALLPVIIGALWGSSALLAVGPVALTSLLVFGALTPLASPGTALWVSLAIWLALYSGAMQFAMGALRLGRIANLVSQPVSLGFINAAAVIIVLSQVPGLLGLSYSMLNPGNPVVWVREMIAAPITALFGGASVVLILLLRKFFPRLPGILIVTILGIAASTALGYEQLGGKVVGALPAGLPALTLPDAISFEQHRTLWPAAFVLALISFTEAMTSCRVIARKQNAQWDENQELMGQGLAKLASGFSGAFPVSGSFSRSALNMYSGAVSPWSTVFSCAAVLVCLLFFTQYLYALPYSVLAAIILVPVMNLIDVRGMRHAFRVSRQDGAVAVVTFAVTLLSLPHLYWGVVAGVTLTMASFLYTFTKPRVIEVSLHSDGTLRDRARFDLAPLAPDLLAVRIDSALNFLSASALERFTVGQCNANPHIKRVLICAGSINGIDASGSEVLDSLLASMRARGIDVQICAIKKQVWDVLERSGWIASLGEGKIYATDREAVAALRHLPPSSGLPQMAI